MRTRPCTEKQTSWLHKMRIHASHSIVTNTTLYCLPFASVSTVYQLWRTHVHSSIEKVRRRRRTLNIFLHYITASLCTNIYHLLFSYFRVGGLQLISPVFGLINNGLQLQCGINIRIFDVSFREYCVIYFRTPRFQSGGLPYH